MARADEPLTAERTKDRGPRGRLRAAWLLVVLAPLSAEASFTGVSMPVLWAILPLLVPMYGAGVLLVRELVARAGGGWASLLLMGVAYELVEDGVGLQALTSPNLYNAAAWGPRVLGLNTVYWESQIGYHVVFSVLVPIALADLVFPRLAGRPYLRRGGLVATAAAAVAGVALLRVFIAGVEDPGYQVPLPVLAGVLAAVAVLAVLALRVLPRRRAAGAALSAGAAAARPLRAGRMPGAGRTPGPMAAFAVPCAATVVFLGLLVPPGHPPTGPAVGEGGWVVAAMALAAAVAAAAGWRVATWARADGFTDRHRIWMIGGALIGHTLFVVLNALVFDGGANAVRATVIGAAVIAVTAALLFWLSHRIRHRSEPID